MANRAERTDEDEIERIIAMSDEEIDAELRAEGIDPDAVAERMRAQVDMLIAEHKARRAGKLSGEGHG